MVHINDDRDNNNADSSLSRYDRTGDKESRVKMSQNLAAAINDGLYDYEAELWDPSDDDDWVSRQIHAFIHRITF